jgi:hypothetical protein
MPPQLIPKGEPTEWNWLVETMNGCAVFHDKKPQGTDGGTFTAGAWRLRDLTHQVYNSGIDVSLSNNRLTIGPGCFLLLAMAPAQDVDQHQARLYNETDSQVLMYGMNAGRSIGMTVSQVYACLTVQAGQQKVIRLEHRCTQNNYGDGFGEACGFGDEVYSIVQIVSLCPAPE